MSTSSVGHFQKVAVVWMRIALETLQSMARTKPHVSTVSFGERLARHRRARGLSQRELAAKSGISNRMIAYYEAQSDSAPIHVIQKLAPVLDVSADELLGLGETPPPEAPASTVELHLWRRIRKLAQLPDRQRRAILQVLDSLLVEHEDHGPRRNEDHGRK